MNNNQMNNNMINNINNDMNYNIINNQINKNMNKNQMNNNMNYNINNNKYNNIGINQMNNINMNRPNMNNNLNNNINNNINYNLNNKINNVENNIYGNNINNNFSNNLNNRMNNIPNNMNNRVNLTPNNMNNKNNIMLSNNNMNINNQNNDFNKGNIQINALQKDVNFNMNNNNNINNNNNFQMSNQNNNFIPNQNVNNVIKNSNNNKMGYQFSKNFSDFKINFNFINNNVNSNNEKNIINNNTNNNENNNIIDNKEAKAFANEIEIISKKLETVFSQDALKYITTEKELLQFFSEKEEEFISYLDDNFGGEAFLKDFAFKQMKEIFTSNPIINHISLLVMTKLNDMRIEEMQSEKEFNECVNQIFEGKNVPKFLLNGPLQELKAILFYENRIAETTTIIKNINQKKSSNSSKILNSLLEQIKQNQSLILREINNRYELIYLFILVNNAGLKHKFWLKFLNFLLVNETSIKHYFSQNFEQAKIYQDFININEQSRNEQIENVFSIIETNINNGENIIYNIIASFYFLLFYQFQLTENTKEFSNIGSTYLNLTLKNFVIFLDKKFKDKIQFGDNLYELLKELYISDMNYLIDNHFYPERNNLIDFEYIDSILCKNQRVMKAYKDLKNKYEPNGLFTKIQNKLHLGEGRDFTTFEKYIKLINCDEFVFTNTITIIIDGFTTEDDNPMEKWKHFVNYFKTESMFYFFKWPSDSLSKMFAQGVLNILRYGSKNFSTASERAKICGKILAYIIYSNEIFKNFQINLIGFSLGNHVIKYCLKELKNLNSNNNNNEIYLKNVILVAAATTFKHQDKLMSYARDIIVDKFKNCYSKFDRILKLLYGLCMMKTAVGRDELNVYYQNKNLIENFDFSPYKYDHQDYNMGVVAKDISGYYKEL